MSVDISPSPSRGFQMPRPKTLLFAAIAAMYIFVLLTVESFLFDKSNPEWAHIAPFQWWLLPHGMAAAFALFLGPFQFSERLRRKYFMVHKTFGYLYIAGCYIGAPLGLYIQWMEEKLGTFSHSFTIATVLDAGIWMFATTMALIMVLSGKVQQHRQWMTRSFCVAIVFLEVRVIAGLGGWDGNPKAIETIVWVCLAMALFVGDGVLQFQEYLRTRPVARAMATR